MFRRFAFPFFLTGISVVRAKNAD